MTYSEEHLSVTLPLPTLAHLIAEKFSEHHNDNVLKANEIFFKTLAVYAVYSYLQMLHIQANLEAIDNWSYHQPSYMSIADLWVTNMCQSECHPVWSDENMCLEAQVYSIPLEIRENRIGYVVVKISESHREATILGFSSAALTSFLKIDELQSLEHLIELLPTDVFIEEEPVKLGQWFQNVFEVCWHTVEALLNPEHFVPGFISRQPQELRVNEPASISRAKLIELGRQSESQQVILVVGLKPTADRRMNIWVEVYPTSVQTYLPHALQIKVLDEEGKVVKEAIARNTKNIQLKFSGESGECFKVKVALDDVNITEAFLI